jgi:apolipoprotein N-acyltransferase
MTRSVGRICAGFYLAVSLAVSYIAFGSPLALDAPGLADLPYFVLIGAHYLWGMVLLASSTEYRGFHRGAYRRLLFVPEILAAGSLLFFLFSYIFAMNANMDYVQRFIQSGGNLRLALDTETERLLVWVRVFPLVAINLGTYFLLRVGRYRVVLAAGERRGADRDRVVRPWALLFTLLGAFLSAIAMPSFLTINGIPVLGWIAYVPIFLVLRSSRRGHALFYGVVFGVFQTLLGSYWLGTFSLVSLQITVLFFFIYHIIFTPIAVHAHRVARWGRVLVFPLAWTVLEFLRSSGFLGYPWALAAHSQYSVLPVIQMASVTGVWGVSFLVLLANSAIAEFLGSLFARRGVKRSFGWLTAVSAVVAAVILAGTIMLAVDREDAPASRVVRVSQIQQNNDPRKHEYEDTLATLMRLTDGTMSEQPDLVIWSETAFVPNIRRWSVDTSSRRYNRLVGELLDYQRGLGTWLVTGNDDYELIRDADGEVVERLEYNAAVFFSDEGERVDTYRKMQLVPFTEHFPYREQLPWVYELLLNFDVNFWEPGQIATVFEHPDVRFSTPICYEDVFPGVVRQYVLGGAEAIFNISNDYWSLTPVQAKQHFVAGLFRAVENRRPVLRTTASGLTGQIDIHGRILQTAPYYEEASLVSDVVISEEQPVTLYTRLGDYFPLAAAALLFIIWLSSLVAAGVSRRRARSDGPAGQGEPPAQPPVQPVPRTRESTSRPRAPAPGPEIPAAAPRPEPSAAESPASAPRDDARGRAASGKPPAAGKPAPPRKPRRRAPKKRKKASWRSVWDR